MIYSDSDWAKLIERTAQLIAHRVCCGSEHDPQNGKLHGYCVVCGVEWPCEYAGKTPATPIEVMTSCGVHGCGYIGACPECYRIAANMAEESSAHNTLRARAEAERDQAWKSCEQARAELERVRTSCLKHEGHEHCVTPCDSIRIQQENHSAYLVEKERADAAEKENEAWQWKASSLDVEFMNRMVKAELALARISDPMREDEMEVVGNWRRLGLELWGQFARYGGTGGMELYRNMALSVLEDPENCLGRLGLIDEKGYPQWGRLDELNEKGAKP